MLRHRLSVTSLILGIALIACQSAKAQFPATPTPRLIPSFLPPTATFTAAPTPTPSATPAPTPTPDYDPFVLILPPAEVTFEIPPTIQHVTETSAIVYFVLSDPAAGVVFYRAPGASVEGIPFGADSASHLVTLANLRPATTYNLLVAVGSLPTYHLPLFIDDVWGPQSVTTAPFPEPLRFAAVGDSGLGDEVTPRLAELMAEQSPAFAIHLGDVVYRAWEQNNPVEAWRVKYFQPFAPLLHQAPVYATIGNHDLEDAAAVRGIPFYYFAFPPFGEPTFPAADGTPLRKWYAFSFSGIQFLSLDYYGAFGGPGRAEQEVWLEERLADPNYQYTIVFTHVPPYTLGLHRGDGLAMRPWAEKFEAAGVPLVLSGHDHNYQRLAHDPTTYIVSGGGSATLYRAATSPAESQVFVRASHFVLFEAYSDRIEVRAIDAAGETIDETSLWLVR